MNGRSFRVPPPHDRGQICGWSEEAAAGFALGSLDSAQSWEYEQHLRECAGCNELVGEWIDLLHRRSPRPQPRPPARLKRRVMLSATLIGLRRWVRGNLRPVIAMAVAIMLLLGVTALWQLRAIPPYGEEHAAMPQTPAAVMNPVPDPELSHLSIADLIQVSVGERRHMIFPQNDAWRELVGTGVASSAAAASGYVLLNERGDLLLFLNGVAPHPDAVDQVWSVYTDHWEHIGMLIQKDRIAYMYVQGADPSGWKAMAVRLVPRAGSISTNEHADTITVQFKY